MFPAKYEPVFYIPEDGILHSHTRENLKSYAAMIDELSFQRPSSLHQTALQSSTSGLFSSASLTCRISIIDAYRDSLVFCGHAFYCSIPHCSIL
jgi:hypothetical protein